MRLRMSHCCFELDLRSAKLAPRHEDGCVLRPADDEEASHPPSIRQRSYALAPLAGTRVVAHLLARVNEDTARGRDETRVMHLAGHGSGRRLVETAHSFGDAALGDHRQAADRERYHLGIYSSALPAERDGLVGQTTCSNRVVLAEERHVGTERE